MGDKTKIEWSEATWNVLTGCSVVSPGCENCYAMDQAHGRLKNARSYAGLTNRHGKWNGRVRFNEHLLDQPLRWRKPRRIFVNSMGDLFHESVPDEWIDQVFGVMERGTQHQFQCLTKRAVRMHDYMERSYPAGRLNPPPNVWLGVSAEDQERANERIPHLLRTPAAIRFVSLEPLLGPIEVPDGEWFGDGLIEWVIVGGESGRHARPMHPAWVKYLCDQCTFDGAAFFFKQWGSWAPMTFLERIKAGRGRLARARGTIIRPDGKNHLREKTMQHWRMHGKMPEFAWEEIEIEIENHNAAEMAFVGKKLAGRELYGHEHNGMPA